MSKCLWKRGVYFAAEVLCILAVSIGIMIFAATKQEIEEVPVLHRMGAVIVLVVLCFFNFKESNGMDKNLGETANPTELPSSSEKLRPLERSLYVSGELSMIVSFFMFFGIDYFQFPLWWRFIAAIPICVSISNALNLKEDCFDFKEDVNRKVASESVKLESKTVSESSAKISGIKRESKTVVKSTTKVSETSEEHSAESRPYEESQTKSTENAEQKKKTALQAVLELRSRKLTRKVKY